MRSGIWPLVVVAMTVAGLVSGVRALGFGEGVLLVATPASAVALAAGVVLRDRGAMAAAAGFGLAGLAWGLGPVATATDAAAHGLAALLGALAMRTLARRRVKTRTSDWLISLVGVSVFTVVVAAVLGAGALAGVFGAVGAWAIGCRVVAFEPLGLLTFGAVLASLREYPAVRGDLRPAVGIAALGAFLIAALWAMVSMRIEAVAPVGVTLLLSAPFCLWVAMQPRSLDGAVLSFLAAHVVLLILLAEIGPVMAPMLSVAVFSLALLVATCQLVHAVNRDRLGALAEVEAQKRELETRVAERTARLRAATERAIAADEAKTRFLATVSHEVRTPLSGVLGMASLILAGDVDPRTRRNVEIIQTSGHHLLDVINRILDYAKLDQSPAPVELATFNLGALVAEVLQEARFLPYAAGLALEADIDPKLPLLRSGYRQGLRQVLTNLVGNAAKFTDAGSVTVRVRAADDRVRIEVADSGPGIPAEARARIFLPFERAGPASGRQGGTGLGLAISAEVVQRMGGRIGVESELGRGSVFWFEVDLPVAAEAVQPAAKVAEMI